MHQNNPTNHKTTQIRILYGCMVCMLFGELVLAWGFLNILSVGDDLSLGMLVLTLILEIITLVSIVQYFQHKINQIKSR